MYLKKAIEAYTPTINFLDPTSLMAWLNMRTLVKETGLGYFKRMDTYMAIYTILVLLDVVYVITYGFDYVPDQFRI